MDFLVIAEGEKLGSLKGKVDLAFVAGCMQGGVEFQSSWCKRQHVLHSMVFPASSVFVSFVILSGEAFTFCVALQGLLFPEAHICAVLMDVV